MAYADTLDALGDGTRRAIFERLRQSPAGVGEIASGLPVSRPAVSQHLKILKDAGLVEARPEGTKHIYRLSPNGLDELRAFVEAYWRSALLGFKAAAEAPKSNQGKKKGGN